MSTYTFRISPEHLELFRSGKASIPSGASVLYGENGKILSHLKQVPLEPNQAGACPTAPFAYSAFLFGLLQHGENQKFREGIASINLSLKGIRKAVKKNSYQPISQAVNESIHAADWWQYWEEHPTKHALDQYMNSSNSAMKAMGGAIRDGSIVITLAYPRATQQIVGVLIQTTGHRLNALEMSKHEVTDILHEINLVKEMLSDWKNQLTEVALNSRTIIPRFCDNHAYKGDARASLKNIGRFSKQLDSAAKWFLGTAPGETPGPKANNQNVQAPR